MTSTRQATKSGTPAASSAALSLTVTLTAALTLSLVLPVSLAFAGEGEGGDQDSRARETSLSGPAPRGPVTSGSPAPAEGLPAVLPPADANPAKADPAKAILAKANPADANPSDAAYADSAPAGAATAAVAPAAGLIGRDSPRTPEALGLPAAPGTGHADRISRPGAVRGRSVGAWFDWPTGLGATFAGKDPFAAREFRHTPLGTGRLHGPGFGAGVVFPVREGGALALYGVVNISKLSGGAQGPPSLYGYSLSTPFRTRLGGRYSHLFSSRVRGYFGLAWEHGAGRVSELPRTPRIPLYGPAGASAFAELGLNLSSFWRMNLDISAFGLSDETGDASGGVNMVFSF
jgi:hypothetical protein